MKAGFFLIPPAYYAPLSPGGVSEDALTLRGSWEDLYRSLANSIAIGSQYRQLQGALGQLAHEARDANWDGYGALPIDQDSLTFAKRLAKVLPPTPTAPEVSVDPDGEVSFDWSWGNRRSFSFSVGPAGTLRYAGIIGDSEAYGKEPWRDGIPEPIVRILQQVVTLGASE